MGEQNSLVKVRGTLGGLTYYKTKDGDLVRQKGGVSKDRIANDPAFLRTRENGMEFGTAGKMSKTIRDCLRPILRNAADSRVTSRLTKAMFQLLKLDATSDRGKRHPSEGIKTEAGKAVLQGFNFNIDSMLRSVLFKPLELDLEAKAVSLKQLSTMNDILYAQGATHLRLTIGVASIDFVTGKSQFTYNMSDHIEIKPEPIDLSLVLNSSFIGEGTKIYVFKIEFSQLLNGKHYSLSNDSFNAMEVIAVV